MPILPTRLRNAWHALTRPETKAASMVFPAYGGGSGNGVTSFYGNGAGISWGDLLPGSQYDYEAAAGDVWLNSAVAACMGWISDNFGEPDLLVERTQANGDVKPISGHPALAALAEPNPEYDADALWQATILSFTAAGIAYWIKAKAPSGKVELYYTPHWEIEPRWSSDGKTYITHYIHRIDGKEYRLEKSDLVVFRHGLDPRNIRGGLPQLRPVLKEIVTDNAANTYCAAILRNMGVPGVVVMPEDGDSDIPEDEAKGFKRMWREGATGDQVGDPIVSSFRVKLHELTATPKKMEIDKLRRVPEARICAAMKIPPTVVGLSVGEGSRSYANNATDERKAYRNCLIPLQKAFARTLTRQLLPDLGGRPNERLRWDYTSVEAMAEDQQAVAKRVTTYYTCGVISQEEARKSAGFGPVVAGETFVTPAGATIGQAGMAAPAGAAPAPLAGPTADVKSEAAIEVKTLPVPIHSLDGLAVYTALGLPTTCRLKLETKFNSCHGPKGRFCSGGGGGGGGGFGGGSPDNDQATAIGNELADHPDPVGELTKEAPEAADAEWQAEAREKHQELLDEQATERKEFEKGQAAELKDYDKGQAQEVKEFDRDQAAAAKEFERDQIAEKKQFERDRTADHKEFEKEQVAEQKAFEKGQAADHKEFEEGQADQHKEFTKGQANDRDDFDANQANERESYEIEPYADEPPAQFATRQQTEAVDFSQTQQKERLEFEQAQRKEQVDFQQGQQKDKADFQQDQQKERDKFVKNDQEDADAFHEGQKKELAGFAEDQVAERQNYLDDLSQDRASFLEDQAAELKEITDGHREARAELVGDFAYELMQRAEELAEEADTKSAPLLEREDDAHPFSVKAFNAVEEDEARQLLLQARRAASIPLGPGPLGPEQRRAVLAALCEIAEARMRDDAEQLRAAIELRTKGLVSDAAAKVAAWKQSAGRFLRRVFLAGALALTDPLTPSDTAALEQATATQMDYLDRFADAILSEDQATDGTLTNRGGMYGSSAWQVAENVALNHANDSGATEGRRILDDGASHHCGVCPDEAAKGWMPLDQVVPIGSTPCGSRCRCFVMTR